MLAKSQLVRCFWGAAVPEPQAVLLTSLVQEQYPEFKNHLRWVKSENCHLTLKFLGSISETIIDSIADEIELFLHVVNPFELMYTNITCFPPKRSHLIVAHLESTDDLKLLVQGMELIAAQFDVSIEQRILRPHVTIARFHDSEKYRFRPIKIENQFLIIDQVILYLSKPTPTGNEYIPLRIIKL